MSTDSHGPGTDRRGRKIWVQLARPANGVFPSGPPPGPQLWYLDFCVDSRIPDLSGGFFHFISRPIPGIRTPSVQAAFVRFPASSRPSGESAHDAGALPDKGPSPLEAGPEIGPLYVCTDEKVKRMREENIILPSLK